MKIYRHGEDTIYWLEVGESTNRVRIPFDSFYNHSSKLRNTTLLHNKQVSASLWDSVSDEFLLLAQEEGIEATENNQ